MSDREEERIVEPEAGVISGDDDVLSQPAPPLDPYTPEPGPGPGEQRAFSVMRWAWVPIIIAVLFIIVALFR